jgi:Lrp/AsnC family leucine-responsive transcriptional regulator
MIDALDVSILEILQENARTPNAEIARRVGLAPSAVFERIRKLEERGTIEGYTIRTNARNLGLGLVCFMFVRSDERGGGVETAEKLACIPEVLEVHHVAGEDCFLVKVRTQDTDALGRLLRDQIKRIGTITSTRTTIVLDTVKETTDIPLALPEIGEEAASG